MNVKQLNPLYFKNINSKKFSTTLIQKRYRYYASINNSNPPLPSYYNNNENDIDMIDFSPETIELIRYRLNSGSKLNYKFNYDTTKNIGEASVLMVILFIIVLLYKFDF
jgi:hypothetical protein